MSAVETKTATPATIDRNASVAADLANAARGVCMGAADVVPGVSGGTIALVLGIYERLVTAISRFDLTLLSELRRGRFIAAGRHVDLRFLAALGCGVFSGLLVMLMVVNRLMNADFSRSLTFAAFSGMIIACGILVALRIKPKNAAHLATLIGLGIIGVAISAALCLLNSGAVEPSLFYLFCCGAIAICAMILPGISGAMVLMLLGAYRHLADIPEGILAGENVGYSIVTVLVFGAGCVTGLAAFSRILKWLLKHAHESTMALLCGFMFGALIKLWPFQQDLTPEIEKFREKSFALVGNPPIDLKFGLVILVVALAMAGVFAIHRFGAKSAK